jgi:S-(hydroxymethyl)glutathione dehydrogenase/alcohol dehydrogenase
VTRTIVAPVLHGAHTDLLLEEVELDDPRQGEVLVRMVASGVCHSCLHVIDGSHRGAPMPIVLGDEGAGIVEAVGPGVTRVAPGDHVIISWAPACGQCHYCVIGRPALCENLPPFGHLADGTTRMRREGRDVYHFGPATYAPAIVVLESCAIKIRDDMPLDKAALIGCAVMTGVGAVINTAGVPTGASLAVFGCGGVGLNAVQGGVLAAAHPIIAVDIVDTKLAFAEGLGATHRLRGDQVDVARGIRQITGRGVDYAIVAVGSGTAVQQAWESLAPGGTCVLIGAPPTGEKLSIEPSRLYGTEARLIGSKYGSARPSEDFPRLVDLYLAGKLRLDELITRRYPLSEINQAHRDLAAGENARGLLIYSDLPA